jgi:cysteinyl-tRNA synthetase
MDTLLRADDVATLKTKANGGNRLVIAYMSIGEAENYRYYWKSEWETNPPSWLAEENLYWLGNYKVRYWDKDWQNIIYGNDDSYLKKILDVGFDGVYLDIIDAFEYFENQ